MPNVHIDFIRHGHSCANLAQDLRGYGLYYKFVEHDPELSGEGVAMAEGVAKDIRDQNPQNLEGTCPDLLISSPLIRAIETAYLMYKNKRKIIIAPFLLEHGIGADNIPTSSVAEQDNILGDSYPALPSKLQRATNAYHTEGNLNTFISWLKHTILSPEKTRGDKDIIVAVVTHSRLMRSDLHLPSKPNNQSIYRVTYSFEEWAQLNTMKPLRYKTAQLIYAGYPPEKNKLLLQKYKNDSPKCGWFGKF